MNFSSKRTSLISLAALLAFTACGCSNEKVSDNDNKDNAPETPTLEKYWADDYQGKYGIQVKELPSGAPRMYMADQLLYVTGVNCFNLFSQTFSMNTFPMSSVRRTFNDLTNEQVPVVRFSAIPYYAADYGLYFEHRDAYLAALDAIATLADENHIGLIPSIFWKPSETSKYFNEEYKLWGQKDSKTYEFMLEYTRDIVNTLKGHKSVFAWEFGNEFSLDANIDIATDAQGNNYPELSAYDVQTAYKGFAELVRELDDHKRLVASGNSVMRNAQWHLLHDKSWTNDSFDQYVEITDVMTPEPMQGMSEHVYEADRVFSDKGTVTREDQIKYALQAAEANGKVYYIGEFTGPRGADEALMRKNFNIYLDQKVQLSLVWNYALRGDVEHSFSAGGDYGKLAFSLMREYNEKFAKLTE